MYSLKSFYHSLLNYFLKIKNTEKCQFLTHSKIDKSCIFEGYNSIGENTAIKNCSLGNGSYIGKNVEFSGVKIGRFCSIGSFIHNATGRHPSSVFVSTHPAFFSEKRSGWFTFCNKQKYQELKYVNGGGYLVEIGNDVWIGDNVLLMDGITIGDGAIIGAGAIVTKDVEPYSINLGIPSQKVKCRFTEEQIAFLLKFQWWNKDWNWIKENWEMFEYIENFIKKFKL
ncbi:MAG: CatB-related O-acetyltransferase [Prevotellaceae bacterium]|jgi:acetyltransferase-like isoleucine patch superfamily enzyme|nr:CatB-related O-acetyltransferase [Prevotellaceae bacterium]